MKLKDLLDIIKYDCVELHNGYDGKLVATSKNSLEKYKDVEVLSAYIKIRTNRDNDFAVPFLYVYGDSLDILKTQERCNYEKR